MGQREYLDDLKTGNPSVLKVYEKLFLLLSGWPSSIILRYIAPSYTVKPHPEAHMAMILFEVFLKSIDLITQHNGTIYIIKSLNYLFWWNQVDILQKHSKKDHVHMHLWTRFYANQ